MKIFIFIFTYFFDAISHKELKHSFKLNSGTKWAQTIETQSLLGCKQSLRAKPLVLDNRPGYYNTRQGKFFSYFNKSIINLNRYQILSKDFNYFDKKNINQCIPCVIYALYHIISCDR